MSTSGRVAILQAILVVAGCQAPRTDTQAPREGRVFQGWRLTERPYGLIDDAWAGAGQGEIPTGEIALVYEPVYREEEPHLISDIVPARGACSHEVRVEYAGPSTRRVDEPATITAWVEGPLGVGHVLHIEATSAAVVIRGVTGAEPLAGRPGLYVLAPGARAAIAFTSSQSGRAGLRISAEREIETEGGRPRPREVK